MKNKQNLDAMDLDEILKRLAMIEEDEFDELEYTGPDEGASI